MDSLTFAAPGPEHTRAASAFLGAFARQGETEINGGCGLEEMPYSQWLLYLTRVSQGLAPGRMPSRVHWAFRPGDPVPAAIVEVRCPITPAEYHNGHIGLAVRPDLRRRHYGAQLVAWAEAQLLAQGQRWILITCDEWNHPSHKMIQHCGYTFYQRYVDEGGDAILLYEKTL